MASANQELSEPVVTLAKKPTDTALAKLPPPSIDRGEVLRWFANNFGFYRGSARGLFISDFAETDEAALEAALLELKTRKPVFVTSGEAFYKQAEHLWQESGSSAHFGKPVLSPIENDLAGKDLVVVRDLSPPKNQAQLWYFYNHLMYPRARRGLTTIITTSKGYEEFMALGANLEDRGFSGRPITWEKAIWLVESSMINLSLFAMLRDSGLPPMLKDEYYLWMSLSERGLSATPQHVFEDYLLDLALVLPDKKIDIECGGTSWLDGDSLTVEDKQRYHRLFADGWQVLRFTTAEILNNYNGCADVVQELCLTGKKRKKPGRLISSVADLSLPLTLPATMAEDSLARIAINHGAGSAALSGAAGTGKTTCIAERVVHLLDQGVDPSNILVLSLLKETLAPIQSLLKARLDSESFEKLALFSWKQFGEKILSENLAVLKRKGPLKTEANPHKVLQRLLIKHLKELDPATVDLSKGLDEFTIGGIIALYKARMISPKQAKDEARDKVQEIVAKIYQGYEEQLQRSNKLDGNDFVTQAVYLLLDRSDIRVRYQNQFDYVLVDELQDATPAEEMMARIIAAPQDNIFVAGDDDQAILSSRGGSVNLLSDISHKSPWTTCYLLAKNWRSDSEISEKAAKVLPLLNARNIEKDLLSGWEDNNKPALIGPQKYSTEREEIDSVLKEIEKLILQGHKPKDIAVVCRQGRYREFVEDSLRKKGIAYVARERQEGLAPNERLDMLSYLRLVSDPDGPRAKEDFERICQIRYKDVDPKIATTIAGFAEANNLSFMRAVEIYSEASAEKSCKELEQLVRVIRNMHQEKLPPAETIALLKRTQRLSDHYGSIRVSPDVYYEPMSTIGELEIAAKDFAGVGDFLKFLTSTRETPVLDETTGGVSVLSVQETKGREYPIVFLVGLSQGSFPCVDNCNPEEEKRLFYVAFTRAQAVLYLSFAASVREKEQEPSEYLVELGYFPQEKVEQATPVVPPVVSQPTTKVGQPASSGRLVQEPPRPRLVEAPKEVEVKQKEVKTPTPGERIKLEPAVKATPAKPPEIPPKPAAPPPKEIVVAESVAPEEKIEPVSQALPQVEPPIELKREEVKAVPQEAAAARTEPIVPSRPAPTPTPGPIPSQNPVPTVKAPPPIPRVRPPVVPPSREERPVAKELAKVDPLPKPEKPILQPEITTPVPTASNRAPVCPACSAAIDGDAKFCGDCGYPILSLTPSDNYVPYTVAEKEQNTCPSCSAEIETGAKFCGECGYKTA